MLIEILIPVVESNGGERLRRTRYGGTVQRIKLDEAEAFADPIQLTFQRFDADAQRRNGSAGIGGKFMDRSVLSGDKRSVAPPHAGMMQTPGKSCFYELAEHVVLELA